MQNKPNIKHANPCPPCPKSATVFEKVIYWLGIGLGSGLPKRAAGTWGSVGGAVAMAVLLVILGQTGFFVLMGASLLAGSYICGKTSALMGVHDDPHIVFDEWVGVWLAYLPSIIVLSPIAPLAFDWRYLGAMFGNPLTGILPFVLFRFFDIIKPFPIGWADKKVSGGFGILLDDILAGVMAAALTVAITFAYIIGYFYIYGP